jgi:DAACS family dicarboxylate/amino acid:cation (Na+ or H+) symporter
MKNHVAIAVGLVAGLVFGLVAHATAFPALLRLADGITPAGTVFVNLIKMVVIPLVVTTLVSGTAGLGDVRRVGRLGLRALAFFWATTIVSIALGMLVMQLATPFMSTTTGALTGTTPPLAPPQTFVDFIVGLVPVNPIKAAADGALLPLIVFSLLFGAAAGSVAPEQRDRIVALADGVTAALIKLVHWIMWLAPVGVFALAAPVTAKAGWGMLQSLGVFIGAVVAGLILFIAVVYLPAVRFAGVRPVQFLKASFGPQAIAFSTTSSLAAIPSMLDAAERDLALPRTVAGLVVPLGASLNRAGSALFQGAAVVFLAHLYGVPLSWGAVGGAMLATFLVSLSVAGVPAASVMTLAPALNTLGIPLDGIGVLLGVDRLPDMARTATNVTGDIAAAIVAARQGRAAPRA